MNVESLEKWLKKKKTVTECPQNPSTTVQGAGAGEGRGWRRAGLGGAGLEKGGTGEGRG